MTMQERPILTTAFAYCLFLDAAVLTFCRFFILEFGIRMLSQDNCAGLSDRQHDFGAQATRSRYEHYHNDSSHAARNCRLKFRIAHVFAVLALVCITVMEGWLANSVRKYGKSLLGRRVALETESELGCKASPKENFIVL